MLCPTRYPLRTPRGGPMATIIGFVNYHIPTPWKVYHFFRQQWLVLGVKLMEINSNLFSRPYLSGHPSIKQEKSTGSPSSSSFPGFSSSALPRPVEQLDLPVHFLSARIEKKQMCQGLNSHYFHIIGDGHQPNSRGLYTHYKDSY